MKEREEDKEMLSPVRGAIGAMANALAGNPLPFITIIKK